MNEQLNLNYNYVSYQKAKKIMHNDMNIIDIYGDNMCEKNVEHIFPQYLFKNDINKNIMKSDLHNLYLCNSKINLLRQNFKYISHEDYIKNNNDKLIDLKGNNIKTKDIFQKQGYIMIVNSKSKKFIPTEYSRGMIARSLGYFAIKYNYVEQLKHVIDIKTLVEWNMKDPVTNDEYYKNIICYKYQNNYNPFILDSDLLLYAFSDMIEIDDELFKKKRIATIDSTYSTELLIKQMKEIENKNILLERKINMYQKKLKKK